MVYGEDVMTVRAKSKAGAATRACDRAWVGRTGDSLATWAGLLGENCMPYQGCMQAQYARLRGRAYVPKTRGTAAGGSPCIAEHAIWLNSGAELHRREAEQVGPAQGTWVDRPPLICGGSWRLTSGPRRRLVWCESCCAWGAVAAPEPPCGL